MDVRLEAFLEAAGIAGTAIGSQSGESSRLLRPCPESAALTEILPFDFAELLECVADLAEVVAVAYLYVESLHFGEQLAKIALDRYVNLRATRRV